MCLRNKIKIQQNCQCQRLYNIQLPFVSRLREVSNFGDSGEIHARARKWAPARRRATRRDAEKPESPKLETTRSLFCLLLSGEHNEKEVEKRLRTAVFCFLISFYGLLK